MKTAFLVVLALIIAPALVGAQTVVQKNGVPVFTTTGGAPAVTGSTYNFLDAGPTPPNPPNDPQAMNTVTGKFASHTCGLYSTTNGQAFGAVFGLTEGSNVPNLAWPYHPSTSVSMSLRAPLHYGGVINMPANPGTQYHWLQADGYGGSCRPAIPVTAQARPAWRVVGVGTTAAPTGLCAGTIVSDNNKFVTFRPSAGPGTDNTAMCNLRPMGSYRVVIEPDTSVPATTLILTYQ
jgi:hypothetical protein